MTSNEPPKEESSTFVRPKKQKDWRIVAIRIGVIAAATVLVCLFEDVVDGGEILLGFLQERPHGAPVGEARFRHGRSRAG